VHSGEDEVKPGENLTYFGIEFERFLGLTKKIEKAFKRVDPKKVYIMDPDTYESLFPKTREQIVLHQLKTLRKRNSRK
jgi:hypothetical protein